MEKEPIKPNEVDIEAWQAEDEYMRSLADDVEVAISAFHVANRFMKNHPTRPIRMAGIDGDGTERIYDMRDAIPVLIYNLASNLLEELNEVGGGQSSMEIIKRCNDKYMNGKTPQK